MRNKQAYNLSKPSVFWWCLVLSHTQLSAGPRTVVRQTPLSMGLSRHEYWSGLPFPTPRDLPNPGMETVSLVSPALTGAFFTTSTTWKVHQYCESSLSAKTNPHWCPQGVQNASLGWSISSCFVFCCLEANYGTIILVQHFHLMKWAWGGTECDIAWGCIQRVAGWELREQIPDFSIPRPAQAWGRYIHPSLHNLHSGAGVTGTWNQFQIPSAL